MAEYYSFKLILTYQWYFSRTKLMGLVQGTKAELYIWNSYLEISVFNSIKLRLINSKLRTILQNKKDKLFTLKQETLSFKLMIQRSKGINYLIKVRLRNNLVKI